MKTKSTCTIRTLAAHLGISAATVSRALRRDPRITEAVRLRVVKAANKLGYKRDPRLSQLMSHIRATKQRAFQGTLAWITDHDLEIPFERKAHALYWDSAVQRAAELGYKLECFPGAHPADVTRIERRLRAQGIQGFVIQQFKNPFHLAEWRFHWPRFAVVQSGSCQPTPTLDRVDGDDLGNCVAVFDHLTRLGYHRPGICTTASIEHATDFALSTAWRRFCLRHEEAEDIPPCLLPDLGPTSARTATHWLKTHRIDCVVSQVRGMKELLEGTGRRVPDDIGLAWQGVNPNSTNSGMWQREDIVAEVIIETLVASVEQGRLGLPSSPRTTLIEGQWHQGDTCKRKESVAALEKR